MQSYLALLAALPLVSAHFKLNYPAARGFNEASIGTFPCGGQDTVSAVRTQWPTTGGPIQLNMGHTASQVEVLIALGNNPGSAFNTILVPTVQETGPNNFCFGMVTVPASIGGVAITAGMNATIQVVTNGDSGANSGLYNVSFSTPSHHNHNNVMYLRDNQQQCADITFTTTPLSSTDYAAHCMNSTGVSVTAFANSATTNANGTLIGAGAAAAASSVVVTATTVVSASSSGAAVATATSKAAAATLAAGVLGAAGWIVAGAAGLL